MDFDLNTKKSDSCSSQLGQMETEESESVKNVGEEEVVKEKQDVSEVMDIEDELERKLDSASEDNVLSASSSILNSPAVVAIQQEQNSEEEQSAVEVACIRGKQKRLTEAQLRRFNWLLGQGHTVDTAHKLACLPFGEPGGKKKRQRSKDQDSPNTSGQAPLTKRPKGYHKPGAGVTFKDMAGTTPIAIICESYPEQRLSREQLMATKDFLLDLITSLDNPIVRPNFRSCEFKQGYLQLACGDEATASWLKEVASTLKPWNEANLKAVEIAELPKLFPFAGYFHDSIEVDTARIFKLVENQNKDLSTKAWRAINRRVIAKTVELMLEVDEKSAEYIVANKLHLNFMFGYARFRRVTGELSNAKRGQPTVHPVNKHAKGGTVLQKDQKSRKAQPPVLSNQAKAGTVLLETQTVTMLQPPTSSNKPVSGTVLLNTSSGGKPQPPVDSKTLKPLKDIGRQSIARRLRTMDAIDEEALTPNSSKKAAGGRYPKPGSSKHPEKNGKGPVQ